MSAVGRHAVLSAIGLVLGTALVVWVRPTQAGAVFLVALVIAIVNAIGAVVWRAPKAVIWIVIVPLLLGSQCGGPATTTTGPVSLGGEQPLTPTRTFLKAKDIPPQGVGAYGVVAFRALPTTSSRDRLLMVCESFLASLPAQTSLPRNVALKDQMVTVWPLSAAQPSSAQLRSCDYLINNYDLFGGLAAIRDAQSQAHPLNGRGPFLIGWSPSSMRLYLTLSF